MMKLAASASRLSEPTARAGVLGDHLVQDADRLRQRVAVIAKGDQIGLNCKRVREASRRQTAGGEIAHVRSRVSNCWPFCRMRMRGSVMVGVRMGGRSWSDAADA